MSLLAQNCSLRDKIRNRTARIGVIGLGYVGIPVALKLAEAFDNVIGLDIDQPKVTMLNTSQYPMKGNEPGIQELLEKVRADGRFKATATATHLADCDIYLLIVDTPLNEEKVPVYCRLRQALETVAVLLESGNMVIIESTIGPNAIEEVIVPTLESGSGLSAAKNEFFLVHCPERVMVGKLLKNLVNYDRVVGGYTTEAAEVAIELYRTFVAGRLEPASMVTAALVKTTENTYRDMEIAFANMLALRCEEVGADFRQVRHLVNRVEGRNVHEAGAGVGGHCIPKEGYLFRAGSRVRDVHRLIELSREINDGMPLHMFELARLGLGDLDHYPHSGRTLKWVVLGVAFLADTDDTRDAPTWRLLEEFERSQIPVVVHDPYVHPYDEQPLPEVLSKADCILFMTAHRAYRELMPEAIAMLAPGAVLVDGRGIFDPHQFRDCRLTYLGVGNTSHLPTTSRPT